MFIRLTFGLCVDRSTHATTIQETISFHAIFGLAVCANGCQGAAALGAWRRTRDNLTMRCMLTTLRHFHGSAVRDCRLCPPDEAAHGCFLLLLQ
jgi:hypothetical protein